MLKLIHAFDMQFYSVREYCCSFEDKWTDLNCYAILISEEGMDEYYKWLYEYEKDMYYLVDDTNPNYIIGYGVFEDSRILNYHLPYLNNGAIGYGIRPSERNKGYGTKLLELLLEKCEEAGMREVCVSCHKDNVSSKNIIIKNNGILEKEFFDDNSGKFALKFWIKLHPKLSTRIKRLIKGEK